ncbi:LOW QUALITY PROTEIN: Gag/polymerase/env Polyprotein [Phytophthora palmivora]|uniref:Gag/polymerase/env Polyprotein n=1 Tax=Phytophthora palmivora TaxID=4796 RepID=A0A2P4YG98_9STRA|nr:LOW QUALITY PROTEIN: Gag/polymerase/env Polyprotein [Phytophthora palmivora]
MRIQVPELRHRFAGNPTESDKLYEETVLLRAELGLAQVDPFCTILREHKDVFPDEIPEELPQNKGIHHEIDLMPGTKYCVTRQWPLSREQVKAIRDFFESRRNEGQVRESKSPHSAPTFCVKKTQVGWRFFHAYYKRNDATVPAQSPIPRKDVIINSMSKSTIYSVLALRDGFYQILMHLTTLSTPRGILWEWIVLLHGLKHSPANFNRSVIHLARSFAPSHLDGKTNIEMRMVHLRKLLELMRKYKLYANMNKCIFGASEMPVLGCLAGTNGVRPDPEKVRVINEGSTPSNVKELRQFLGLATTWKTTREKSSRCRNFSKKEATWIWTSGCHQAFEAAKLGLTEAPILTGYGQDRPFHVGGDGSDFVIGCALMQLDHEGRGRVVYYQSRQLSEIIRYMTRNTLP